MLIESAEVQRIVVSILRRFDVPVTAAKLQAELLVSAELRGQPSHGLLRLRRITERIQNGVCDPRAVGRHTWSGSARLDVDGELGLGPVVAVRALQAITERAADTGVATALLRNTNHLGMLGWYLEDVARRGYAALAFCTSEALVHPWGGRDALLGTNPIAIAVPGVPDPLLLDMATSRVSMGKIHDYARRDELLEEGWALDVDGNPTTSAAQAIHGSIAPFGGAKGYGLALAIEVLVAELTGTSLGQRVKGTLDSVEPSSKGDLFVVFGRPADQAVEAVGRYLDSVRHARPAEPDVPVTVPGDGARKRQARSLHDGVILSDPTWEDLCELAQQAQEMKDLP